MNLEKYFTKDEIIYNLAKYELYYQVSLGKLTAVTKAEEIDYDIEFQYALGSIYEMLKDISTLENFNDIFDEELKKQSAMDALQKFANDNLEAVKVKSIEIENMVNEINDNIFFNETMIEVCQTHEKIQIEKWATMITDDLANAILNSFKELESNKEA